MDWEKESDLPNEVMIYTLPSFNFHCVCKTVWIKAVDEKTEETVQTDCGCERHWTISRKEAA